MKILCLLTSLLLATTSLVMGFHVRRLTPTRSLMISAVKKDGTTAIIKKDNGENTKKKSLLGRLKNSRGTAAVASAEEEFVQSEWDELVKAEELQKESWEAMLQAKRDTWKTLKETGKLQQLVDEEGVDEDLLEEIEKDEVNRSKNKQLMESLQAMNKGGSTLTPEEKLAKEMENKLVMLLNTDTSGGVVAVFNYLTELKDKNIYNATLISASLDAISKG